MTNSDLINNISLFESLSRKPRFAWPTIIMFIICAGIIVGSTLAAIYGYTSYLTTCLINGVAGYFLFSPMHDAIHSAIGNSKQLNLWVGRITFLYFSSLVAFELMRHVHFRHHRNANGAGDEADYVVQSGPAWLRPLKWPFIDLIYGWKYLGYWKERPKSEIRNVIIMFLATMVVWPWLIINGYLTELLMFWIIPQRISFFFISFIFVYLPHVPHEVPEQENAYRATSNRSGMEWLFSPLMMYQNYHLVHHLYPNIPFYRMVKIWNAGLDEHLSHDPALVPALGLYPLPAKTEMNVNKINPESSE